MRQLKIQQQNEPRLTNEFKSLLVSVNSPNNTNHYPKTKTSTRSNN
jgi:hypothetical protein